MLNAALRDVASYRKMRLAACACCRRALVEEADIGSLVDIGERWADGLVELEEVFQEVDRNRDYNSDNDGSIRRSVVFMMFFCDSERLGATADRLLGNRDSRIAAANDVRCIYGNPFPEQPQGPLHWLGTATAGVIRMFAGSPMRPTPEPYRSTMNIEIDPRWLSSTVLDLARTIYDERLFERMPILADALMDAGCDSEEIINHCRGTGPHVRGCWVVDLLLGKT